MVLLNEASKVYAGGQAAIAIYAGTEKVWPPAAVGITPPVFRSIANTTYTGRNDTDIPVPAGVQLNDILLASLLLGRSGTASTDPVIPSGWAQVGTTTTVSDSSGFKGKFGIYWKRASASEPASYQWAQWEGASTQGTMVAYSGCPTTGSPIDVFSQNSSSGSGNNTATGTGVTTTQANDMLVWMGHNWTASGTLSPPTGMAEKLDHLTYVADEVVVSAALTGDRVQTQAVWNEPWSTFMIALKGIGTPPATEPTTPDHWLVTSITPSSVRNDFGGGGELGERIFMTADQTFTWIGLYNGGTTVTPVTARVVEWFDLTVMAEAVIDMTTKPIGTWVWKKVPPFTLRKDGYYCVGRACFEGDGNNWLNQSPITTIPLIGNTYACYRAYTVSSFNGGALDHSYGGADIGWDDPVVVGPPVSNGLTIWLDASQLALADGALVTTWPSLVGSLVGTNLNPSPDNPVLKTNIKNGLPVVRFRIGTGIRFSGTGIDLNWTIFYVGHMTGAATGRVVTSCYPPSNLLMGFWNGYQDVFYVEGFLTPNMQTSQTTDWKLYTGIGEGVPGNAACAVFSNGVYMSGGQPMSQNGGGWKGYLNLNGYAPNDNQETCECEIAEVLFYDHMLTDPERASVEAYLRTKWGLSTTVVEVVPSTDPPPVMVMP